MNDQGMHVLMWALALAQPLWLAVIAFLASRVWKLSDQMTKLSYEVGRLAGKAEYCAGAYARTGGTVD